MAPSCPKGCGFQLMHTQRPLKVTDFAYRPAAALTVQSVRHSEAANRRRSVPRAIWDEDALEYVSPAMQRGRGMMLAGIISKGQVEGSIWLITVIDPNQVNMVLQTMAAVASALGAFKEQNRPPLQVVRITAYSKIQRLLAAVGLGQGEQYLAVDRSDLSSKRTSAALERQVLQMFKLSPGKAKILAVSYTGGTRRTQVLQPGTKVRAFIEAADVLEVVDV